MIVICTADKISKDTIVNGSNTKIVLKVVDKSGSTIDLWIPLQIWNQIKGD